MVVIKLCQSVFTITEQTCSDAFPIASTQGEGIAGRDEVVAISTVSELVTVLQAVVSYAQPESGEVSPLDDLSLAISLDENAFFTKADSTELLT